MAQKRGGCHVLSQFCVRPLSPSAYLQFDLPPELCRWWGTPRCVHCDFQPPAGCAGDCAECALDCQCRKELDHATTTSE